MVKFQEGKRFEAMETKVSAFQEETEDFVEGAKETPKSDAQASSGVILSKPKKK